MGLERNEFCAMLITKVIQINDWYICNDEELASIFKVIERFAAMKLQIHNVEHPNIENTNVIIEDTNNCKEIILKLWLKKNKIRIVSPEMFCKRLKKEVKRLLNQTNKFQFKTKTNIQINTVDKDNDIIIEEKNENIMDEDNDIDVSGNDEIEQSATATCPVITIGNWKISQFDDNSPNMYHSILDDTVTHIKPAEILQMEQKYDKFVPEFFEQHKRIPLFDELPYYVRDKLQYMGVWDRYNWDKCANNEYLNDNIVKHLSNLIRSNY